MVDGTLGMAYGVTATSVLLDAGGRLGLRAPGRGRHLAVHRGRRAYMAGLLVVLGGYVLLRFSFRSVAAKVVSGARPDSRFLAPLGLVAGFIDATGGGGWGPVATSTLLSSGRTAAGGLVVLTNLRIVFDAAGTEGGARGAVYVVLVLAWMIALSTAVRALWADRAEAETISLVVAETDQQAVRSAAY